MKTDNASHEADRAPVAHRLHVAHRLDEEHRVHEEYRSYVRQSAATSTTFQADEAEKKVSSPDMGGLLATRFDNRSYNSGLNTSVVILAGAGQMKISEILLLAPGDRLSCPFADGHGFSLVSGGVVLFNLKLHQLTQLGMEFEIDAIGEGDTED